MSESAGEYQSVPLHNDNDPGSLWLSPKGLIPLHPTETQIWQLTVALGDPIGTDLLSAEELARANRFRHAESRAHFIAGRSALRLLLAENLATAPDRIRFTTGPQGKPALDPPSSLGFNLAHSGGVVLIALANNAHLGVDLEQITPNPDLLDIAARMFAPDEQANLAALPPEAQQTAFFRLWSRKEAVIKADGRGLSLPTRSFSTLGNLTQAAGQTFALHDLPLGPTHSAALATTDLATRLHLLRFPAAYLPRR